MKTVVMSARNGEIGVEEVPAPQALTGRVLIRNHFSLISAGTERATVQTGQQSLIGKARQRPDEVKQVLQTMRQIGPLETYRLVSDRLDAPMVLGYSSAGTVIEIGEGVDDLRPGDLVAAAGAGYASHAEIISVPKNLCTPVPDGVSPKAAAFATVGAIALQGIHQANAQPGSRIAVIGLGLVGQLTVRFLRAYGYDAVGIDRDPAMLELARRVGVNAFSREDENLIPQIKDGWRGATADAVLITAATKSTDPVELAGQLARDRATVVIVGDVNVAPPRSSYYGKELSIVYSRSYGPGRYDPMFEEGGVEYPIGYVPWSERRNLAEFLRVCATGDMDIDSLDPVIFPAEEAAEAYAKLSAAGAERRVAILLSYEHLAPARDTPVRRSLTRDDVAHRDRYRPPTGPARIAAVGAGSFPTKMLFPHLRRNSDARFGWITTGSGLTAAYQGKRWEFEKPVGSFREGMAEGGADAVMVLSRHDTHGHYATEVLEAGLGLFCEKPIGLTEDELESVAAAWERTGAPAMIGFNRRFAPGVQAIRKAIQGRGPIQVAYRVFAGKLAPDHWYFDLAQGGRILGEVCHFVDTAGFLVGAPPIRVSARSADTTADPVRCQSVSALIEYADGSTATILYSGLTPGGVPKEFIEVAANGVAARLEDFESVTIWSGTKTEETYRGGPKGHAEEMKAFVDLLHGRPAPDADFRLGLLSSLATLRIAQAVTSGGIGEVRPKGTMLAAVLGIDPLASESDGDDR